jgi:hypothetical protein
MGDKDVRLRAIAIDEGRALAERLFAGRSGHGGTTRVVYRQLREPELAATLAIAFERGARWAQGGVGRTERATTGSKAGRRSPDQERSEPPGARDAAEAATTHEERR